MAGLSVKNIYSTALKGQEELGCLRFIGAAVSYRTLERNARDLLMSSKIIIHQACPLALEKSACCEMLPANVVGYLALSSIMWF